MQNRNKNTYLPILLKNAFCAIFLFDRLWSVPFIACTNKLSAYN